MMMPFFPVLYSSQAVPFWMAFLFISACYHPSFATSNNTTSTDTSQATLTSVMENSTSSISISATSSELQTNSSTSADTLTTGTDTDTTGEESDCDVLDSNSCSAGSKCMPYASTNAWDGTKCTPLDANPKKSGEACKVVEKPTSGIDNCVKGLICWFVDENLNGTCLEMCQGANHICPAGQTCKSSNNELLNLCLHDCHPLIVDCPEGQICIGNSSETFSCDIDASGDKGAYGDSCEYINVCDPGLFCAGAEFVVNCNDQPGCCTLFCDLNEPNTCPDKNLGMECYPYYEPGTEPQGLENVGACIVPPP